MQLKVDLHTHVRGDPIDDIKHSAKELVVRAIQSRYGALAITNHTHIFYDSELDRLAEDYCLTLITGMETNVGGRHVLIYCIKEKSVIEELNRKSREGRGNLSFDQISDFKEQGKIKFVMAPHPYFLLDYCLGDQLVANHELFDLVELSPFHTTSPLPRYLARWDIFNRNRLAEAVAQRFGMPVFASSDTHDIRNFGKAYSLVESEPNLESIVGVLQSRDQRKIEPVTNPIPLPVYAAKIPWIYWISLLERLQRNSYS